ncbi:hypothetical protein D3C81_1479720 [compost metagenome]
MNRFFLHQLKPGLLINLACSRQVAGRPQGHFPVTHLPGKAQALLDQTTANAQTPRAGVDVEHAQFGGRFILADDEHGADDLAVLFGNPAALTGGVVIAQVLGDHLGH